VRLNFPSIEFSCFLKQQAGRFVQGFPFWPCIFFTLGFLAYAMRAVGYFSAVPGDLGDARFNSIILEHIFRWMTGREAYLWSPAFFYPFEHMLAFSDNHFGTAIFYAFFRSLGLSRELSFDGWFLTGITLSYFCTYLAFRRIGFHELASAAGAFIFCFSLPVLHIEDNAQLIYRFATPLAFAAFWNLLSTRQLYLFWQIAFWGVIQFFCSIYLGVYLFYLLTATLLAWLIVADKKNYFSDLLSGFQKETSGKKSFFLMAIGVSASMLAWLLYHYYAVTMEYPVRPPEGHPLAFTIPISQNWASLCQYFLNNFYFDNISYWFTPGNRIFFGFGVWILFIFGAVKAFPKRAGKSIGAIAVISFIVFFVFTLSISGHSLYQLLYYLPGLKSLRAGTRMVLAMLLPVGVLAAITVETIQNKCMKNPSAVKALLLVSLFFLLGAEVAAYQPRNTAIREWQARKNALFEKLPAQISRKAILFVTIKENEPFHLAELDGMILAQDLGIPTLNGYSGNVPPGYAIASPCSSPLNRLHSYASYRKLPPAAIAPLAQRVVTISPTPCPHEPDMRFSSAPHATQPKVSPGTAKENI
jgi:hypothetical protein